MQGIIVGTSTIAREITQRKQIERALEDNRGNSEVKFAATGVVCRLDITI